MYYPQHLVLGFLTIEKILPSQTITQGTCTPRCLDIIMATVSILFNRRRCLLNHKAYSWTIEDEALAYSGFTDAAQPLNGYDTLPLRPHFGRKKSVFAIVLLGPSVRLQFPLLTLAKCADQVKTSRMATKSKRQVKSQRTTTSKLQDVNTQDVKK